MELGDRVWAMYRLGTLGDFDANTYWGCGVLCAFDRCYNYSHAQCPHYTGGRELWPGTS